MILQEPNDDFYTKLPVHKTRLTDLLQKEDVFQPVPPDWHIVITDIRNSTPAVEKGAHQEVNLIAVGSIISLLNLAFDNNIMIPFFFGGDGATFIIPSSLLAMAMPALLLYKKRALTDFNLDLRIGTLKVADIYTQGLRLDICKFCFTELFPIPVISGTGLHYAESIVKGEDYELTGHEVFEGELNLYGMQCRWDRIPPPEKKDEVVTLLVNAANGHDQQAVFSRVLKQIDKIYGSHKSRHPVSIAKLTLKSTFNRLGKEMRARIGKIHFVELFYQWFLTLLGPAWFKTKKGKRYLEKLVEMSDTLVLDGRINTVISGTAKQRRLLVKALDAMEKEGQLFYGIHLSNAIIMSCYVRDMQNGHIHFVDGADGGYTRAAAILKVKLKMAALSK